MKNKLNQPDVEQSTTKLNIEKYQEALIDIRCDTHNFIENNYDDAFKMVYNKQFKLLQDLIDIHSQPDPTLEEVKKEWEDDGWEWKEDYSYYKGCEYERYCISKKFGFDEKIIVLEEYNKKIYLFYGYETFDNEGYKVFENKSFKMSFKELQRITKTFKAKGWEV